MFSFSHVSHGRLLRSRVSSKGAVLASMMSWDKTLMATVDRVHYFVHYLLRRWYWVMVSCPDSIRLGRTTQVGRMQIPPGNLETVQLYITFFLATACSQSSGSAPKHLVASVWRHLSLLSFTTQSCDLYASSEIFTAEPAGIAMWTCRLFGDPAQKDAMLVCRLVFLRKNHQTRGTNSQKSPATQCLGIFGWAILGRLL